MEISSNRGGEDNKEGGVEMNRKARKGKKKHLGNEGQKVER